VVDAVLNEPVGPDVTVPGTAHVPYPVSRGAGAPPRSSGWEGAHLLSDLEAWWRSTR
jgi:hypothetical protein